MNSFFKTFFACLLAIVASGILNFIFVIMVIMMLVAGFSSSSTTTVAIKDGSVLRIDLSVPIVDKVSSNPFAYVDFTSFKLNKQMSVLEVTTIIERAAEDPRISGIVLDIPMATTSGATTLYELRQALQAFKMRSAELALSGDGHKKKFVVSYADVYSQAGIYLASVADSVYVNPQGGVDWRGLSSSVMFYKGLFAKLGVEPEIIRHGKFKGAVEPYMLDGLSAENRLQIDGLLASQWGFLVGEIARGRGVDSVSLQRWASELTIGTAADAVDCRLVDKVVYRDQFLDIVGAISGSVGSSSPSGSDGVGDVPFVTLGQYAAAGGVGGGGATGVSARGGDVLSSNEIAVVYADGGIVDQGDPDDEIVGNKLAEVLAKIRKNEQIKGVVLRVNSPGGSAMASDIVWREVSLLRDVKPVVVSMGEYAASGGYYISCAADRIVASPLTLTGSIGVFGMMFNVAPGAKSHLGVTTDVVATNRSADMGSIFRALTPAERLFVQRGVDTVYSRFVSVVAQGRGLTWSDVDAIGQGRVWSGVQAVSPDVRLVDQWGGIQDAVDLTAELAGVGTDYRLTVLPKVDDSFFGVFTQLTNEVVARVAAKVSEVFVGGDKVAVEAARLQKILDKQQGIRAQMEYQFEVQGY